MTQSSSYVVEEARWFAEKARACFSQSVDSSFPLSCTASGRYCCMHAAGRLAELLGDFHKQNPHLSHDQALDVAEATRHLTDIRNLQAMREL